jgi:hypothetical protein
MRFWHAPVCVAPLLLAAACCKHEPRLTSVEVPQSAEPPPVTTPPRCALVGKELVLGTASSPEAEIDEFMPFATEVGRGVAYDPGFAVGALTRQGEGTGAVVAFMAGDGTRSRVVSLGASHGDAEPPRVFARGSKVGAAVLEPSGNERSLRVARLDTDSVTWGAEFLQGNDEPLAFDVALSEKRGVAVWDDIPKDRDVSGIFVGTFDPNTFAGATPARVITLLGTDADEPRLANRPGGFWLFWIARRPEQSDFDARYRAEDISYKWLEVVPLDDKGALAGAPRKLGSDRGHVLVYDVAEGRDGSAIVMWRDDDTPSGSPGGRLRRALVRLGGVDGPDEIDDEHLGFGAPNVSSGWLAIADATNPTRIAPMGADGALLDRLGSEALLGSGEPLASKGETLLISRPAGVAVRLFVARCNGAGSDGGTALGGALTRPETDGPQLR